MDTAVSENPEWRTLSGSPTGASQALAALLQELNGSQSEESLSEATAMLQQEGQEFDDMRSDFEEMARRRQSGGRPWQVRTGSSGNLPPNPDRPPTSSLRRTSISIAEADRLTHRSSFSVTGRSNSSNAISLDRRADLPPRPKAAARGFGQRQVSDSEIDISAKAKKVPGFPPLPTAPRSGIKESNQDMGLCRPKSPAPNRRGEDRPVGFGT